MSFAFKYLHWKPFPIVRSIRIWDQLIFCCSWICSIRINRPSLFLILMEEAWTIFYIRHFYNTYRMDTLLNKHTFCTFSSPSYSIVKGFNKYSWPGPHSDSEMDPICPSRRDKPYLSTSILHSNRQSPMIAIYQIIRASLSRVFFGQSCLHWRPESQE